MILPDTLSISRVRALLDGIADGSPGAEMAEKWLWLMHKRLTRMRYGIKLTGLGYASMLAYGLAKSVMMEANMLAQAIQCAKAARAML